MAKYGKMTWDEIEATINVIGGEENARRLRAGELRLVEVAPDLVRIDRTVRPIYPSWVKEILHPELEMVGPAEFDSASLERWLHDSQKKAAVKGQVIYDHLKQNDMISSCLGLRDLEAIQKKGIDHFRKHFKGQAVFGWKSVVRSDDGYLFVPYLCGNDGEVVLNWVWLTNLWISTRPALRFA